MSVMIFTLIILLIIGTLFALGFFALNGQISGLINRSRFVEEYLFRLGQLVSLRKENEADELLLRQLGSKATKMDNELVSPVVIGETVTQVENSLGKLLRSLRNDNSQLPQLEESYTAISNHLSRLNNEITEKQKIFTRPVALMTQGVRLIFHAPVKTLGFAKILNSEQMQNLEYSAFMDKLSVFSSYAGLIASAVAIVTRWANYFALIDMLAGQ